MEKNEFRSGQGSRSICWAKAGRVGWQYSREASLTTASLPADILYRWVFTHVLPCA